MRDFEEGTELRGHRLRSRLGSGGIGAVWLAEHGATGDPLPDGVTQREVEVMRLVALGRGNPEIAEELVLRANTVTRHVTNTFDDKTSTANRVELVRYAFEHGLADERDGLSSRTLVRVLRDGPCSSPD